MTNIYLTSFVIIFCLSLTLHVCMCFEGSFCAVRQVMGWS
jgi:hypothetical protein